MEEAKTKLKVYCETVVTKAGFQCPAIVTPENFMKEDLE